jgi:hypothetical protein
MAERQMSLSQRFSRLSGWLRRLMRQPEILQPVPSGTVQVIKTSLIIIDPILAGNGRRRLSEVLGWHHPDRLVDELIHDLAQISHGFARYQITERIIIDEFPMKEDQFRYTEAEYLRVWQTRQNIHQPDAIDYQKLLHEHSLLEKVRSGLVDEVWTVSFPWAGFYESRMAGPGAYFCNAPPLPDTQDAGKRFIIMAFNYERGVGEMLESYGHRAESILSHVYRHVPGRANLWERFTRYDKSHPGKAEVGNVHFAPNSRQDYDWGNPAAVLSHCRAWQNFPDLSAPAEMVTCREWGSGDIRAHHRWWFSLMPHQTGQSDGISNNWWDYIVDPNQSE